ncbi:MAG: serine protease [Candidatus Dadabacteria bacterium]|nr:serine protease [Candidatus Dadabacteria bacterium]
MFLLAVIGFSSCVVSEDNPCDLTSQTNAQRGSTREDYYPEELLNGNFSRDYGNPVFPKELSEDYYDIARKVSRSVFEMEVIEGSVSCSEGEQLFSGGTAWLIAPKYVVTAAHTIEKDTVCTVCTVCLHTFDGKVIKAEKIVYTDSPLPSTDLAVLELEKEVDAIPMKIADQRPGRNEVLMAIGQEREKSRGLGAWRVTAGPALELESPYTVIPGSVSASRPGIIYHALPTGGGMSGGPVFNKDGEVVSIVSAGRPVDNVKSLFGVNVFRTSAAGKLRLWLYGFDQRGTTHVSFGPNPSELRGLYEKIGGEPGNAGEYRDDNNWARTGHQLGDSYSPFPVDRFEHMNEVYKEARKGAVTIHATGRGGSGFIYDDSTVITAGHVAHTANEKGLEVDIRTINDKTYKGRVVKIQSEPGICDIAIIKTTETLDLSGDRGIENAAKKLEIGDSSSLRCGDPLVQIGSGHLYNNAGLLQGVGAVYQRTRDYVSEFFSPSVSGGMSGGPVVNEKGEVITLGSSVFGAAASRWEKPGPLFIHTRLPVYMRQDASDGPNSETMKKFIEDPAFYCPSR